MQQHRSGLRPASASRPRETFSHLQSSTRAPASARARSCRHHYKAFFARTSRSVPVLRFGTLASRFWPLGLSPFTSERLVPAVPCNRLHPLHALSTPVATCSVIRHPAGSSQESFTPLVLTTLDFLTTRPRKVHFRSSLGCAPAQVFLALFLQRSLPWLLTPAAWRCFETCS